MSVIRRKKKPVEVAMKKAVMVFLCKTKDHDTIIDWCNANLDKTDFLVSSTQNVIRTMDHDPDHDADLDELYDELNATETDADYHVSVSFYSLVSASMFRLSTTVERLELTDVNSN